LIVAGERLVARCDRSLYWPRLRTLLVADVHLGKAASFRKLGAIPVTGGTTAGTLDRLGTAIEESGAERLVILGDLWHSRAGKEGEVLAAFAEWRVGKPGVEIALVSGNHDRRSGCLPENLAVREWEEGHVLGPFILRHAPGLGSGERYGLAGHLHPAVRMVGGGESLSVPCFWLSSDEGVLPSFGDFTGNAVVAPMPGDQVIVCAGDQLVRVGT